MDSITDSEMAVITVLKTIVVKGSIFIFVIFFAFI